MRNLGEIAHPSAKISLFNWNGKFLVKFEQGLCEQTLKFEELELNNGEAQVRAQLTTDFIDRVISGFPQMHSLRQKFVDQT